MEQSVTKLDLALSLHDRLGLTQKKSTEVTELILDLMKDCLVRGEKVMISGFGNFTVQEKRPRKGRNPQTGEELIISGRKVVTFAPSHVLRDRLNGES